MLFQNSRTLVALIASAVVACPSPAGAQTTYYVNGSCGDDSWTGLSPVCEAPNGPKKTIQAGIDAADHFDSVEVADGVYRGAGNKNLEFFTKEMSIRSSGGPANCIIDCEKDGFGFTFCTLPDDRPVTIEGFTIRNGRSDSAGGICIASAAVTIDSCIIEHCVTTGGNPEHAGGIFITDSPVLITRTIVRSNRAEGVESSSGGGIKILARGNRHAVRIEDSEITGNVAEPILAIHTASGGGVYAGPGVVLHMTRCLVADNRAVGNDFSGGGGVFTSEPGDGEAIIEHTEIRSNHLNPDQMGTMAAGGGASLGSGAILRDCTVIGNSAARGGGLALKGSSEDAVQRTLVQDNLAHLDGGGVYCRHPSGEDIQLISNVAGRDGGGIYFAEAFPEPRWTRLTLIDNRAERDGGGAFAVRQLDVGHSVFKSNLAGRDGGAIHSSLVPALSNSLLIDNEALGTGGAIYSNWVATEIVNSTIVRNTAANGGGGLHIGKDEAFERSGAHNCIFRLNLPVSIVDRSGQLRVIRSNVEGGWPGAGNLDLDPLFTDPSNDDFRLLPGSLCIDAGLTGVLTSDLDLAGNPRRADDRGMPDAGIGSDPIVDMGCYEFQGTSTGFIAVHPRPGVAGQSNQLQAAGATPGNVVYFVYGFSTGSTGVPGCPGLTIDIANPRLATQTTADGSGYASKIISIPGAASGRSIILQAVDRAACEVSNAVGYRFP